MSAEFLDFILEVVISYLVPILELIGVFIVAYGTIKSFIKFIRSGLNSDDTRVKIDLAETLALSLEFKMAGEILKTVVSHTIEEWNARQSMPSANMLKFRKRQSKIRKKLL